MACEKSWCISNRPFFPSAGAADVCLDDAPGMLATEEVEEEESDITSNGDVAPFWYGSGLLGLGGG